MSYERCQKIFMPQDPGASTALVNLNATAGIVLTLIPDDKERLWVYHWGLHFLEAVAADGFNTTLPVVTLQYDSANGGSPVAKSTWTGSTTAIAIGEEHYGTDFTPFRVDGPSGDALEFNLSTQGAGQTVTGEACPFIIAYTEHLVDGAA